MAYLPVCDLALLLIDAGTTLNDEDIGTMRLLYEAGIPALVLLSKSDLLAEGDLHRTVAYIKDELKRELGITVIVHAVSSLPASSVLLDHFFEQELLPRFEEAQALREASMARKIGALRDSVTAALDTILNQGERDKSRLAGPVPELESRLRVVTGEIGEVRTSLDRTFLEFGESPQSVIDKVVDRALSWTHSNACAPLTALQLSEWIHDVVQEFLNQQVERLRAAFTRAVGTLQQVAEELGNNEAPSQEDFSAILRDAPRFELAALPNETSAGKWKWPGDRAVRAAIAKSLREGIGTVLHKELHLYGYALRQWSDQAIRKIETVVNSYADAYRAQIHRTSGLSESAKDLAQAQSDLNILRNWSSTEDSNLAAKRA